MELGYEREGFVDSVEDMAANHEVRRGDLGVLPGARDHGHVVDMRNLGAHAFGRLYRGDPFEALRQWHRVPAGSSPRVDECQAWCQIGLDNTEEVVEPMAGDSGVGRRSTIPVAGGLLAARSSGTRADDGAPALGPIDLR